ncbi:MAG: ATP-binding protein [Atopobiaceae bacterium]|nr:ATP-binding protein [Atopobiaceae bacterium]
MGERGTGKRHTSLRFRVIVAVAAVVLAGFSALAIGDVTNKLGNQLDQTGYKNMTTYAEQCASGIGEMRIAYSNLVRTIDVSKDWRSSKGATMADMRRVMDAYDVYYLAYLGTDGTGFDSEGNSVTLGSLPCGPDAFTDTSYEQESTAYIGNTGRYEYMVQYPITSGGELMGDFYIGVSVTAQFNYLKDANYQVFVIESGTGRTIGSQGTTAIANNNASSIYKIVDNYARDEDKPAGSDEHARTIDSTMSGQQTVILPVYNSDTAQVCCLTPVPSSPWYVCVRANLDDINGGKANIVGLVYQLIVALLVAAVALVVILLAFQLKSSREHERATERLEALNARLMESVKAADQANAAKSKFLSNMSHDIRTPMNAIVGMTSMALASSDNETKVREDLQVIKSSSAHLLGLVNDVLDLSRIESGRLVLDDRPFTISSVIGEVLAMIRPLTSAKGQSLTLEIGDVAHEYLLGDAMRLKQILINVMNNANKYTPAGGSIRVAVCEEPRAEDGDPERATFRIVVTDNGIGIPADKLTEIFEPFSRVTDSTVNAVEGTGLGLAIVKQIVTALGGTVSATSTVDVGSAFTVTVPFGIDHEGESRDSDALSKMRVVYLCRDEEGAERARRLLEGTVGELVTCRSFDEALALAQGRKGGGQPFSAALVDSDDDGSDVLELIRKGHETLPDLPVALLCKLDWTVMERKVRDAGVVAFCQRPLFRSSIRETLVEMTAKGPDPDVPQRYLDGINVLEVDDNAINRMVAKMTFEHEGADVTAVESGEAAIKAFEGSEPGHYRLILMDVMMPTMNGYEATAAIRALDRPDARTVVIVAMTANAFAEDIAKAREAGMDAHIAKPVDPQVAQRTIKRLLFGV